MIIFRIAGVKPILNDNPKDTYYRIRVEPLEGIKSTMFGKKKVYGKSASLDINLEDLRSLDVGNDGDNLIKLIQQNSGANKDDYKALVLRLNRVLMKKIFRKNISNKILDRNYVTVAGHKGPNILH